MRSSIGLTWTLIKAGYEPNQIIMKLALRRALVGCESVLDVGCGAAPNMRLIGIKHPVGAEGYAPSVEKARQLGTHDEIVPCDVRALGQHFNARQFDACVALDVIEHLPKADGLKLIADMERIAKKRIIFFTPSGFLSQGHTDKDDLQPHLSGWEPDEMRQKGYEVQGLLGPKSLRGEYHRLMRRPAVLWGVLSLLGHFLWTGRKPERAAAILCVKTIT